jgi:hypothetical protein
MDVDKEPEEEAAEAPAPDQTVMICIRESDGSLPDLPVEQQAAFKEWFEEMARRCLNAPREKRWHLN